MALIRRSLRADRSHPLRAELEDVRALLAEHEDPNQPRTTEHAVVRPGHPSAPTV